MILAGNDDVLVPGQQISQISLISREENLPTLIGFVNEVAQSIASRDIIKHIIQKDKTKSVDYNFLGEDTGIACPQVLKIHRQARYRNDDQINLQSKTISNNHIGA